MTIQAFPDMVMMSFGNYEFGVAEVAKEAANTKKINEGRIKCCEIMNAMLANIVETYPSLQQQIKASKEYLKHYTQNG